MKRILLANELTELGAIRWVGNTLDSDPGFEFTCLVDSLEGIQRLDSIHGSGTAPGRPGGAGNPRGTHRGTLRGGRSRGRPGRESLGRAWPCRGWSATKASSSPRIPRPMNGASWPGWTPWGTWPGAARPRACSRLRRCCCPPEGSAYFDLVARSLGRVELGRPSRVLLRSGCYLSHDAGHYRRLVDLLEARLPGAWRAPSHLAPALEVWGQVLSRPEPGLAFLNLGKRDVAHDLGLPRPATGSARTPTYSRSPRRRAGASPRSTTSTPSWNSPQERTWPSGTCWAAPSATPAPPSTNGRWSSWWTTATGWWRR